MNKYKLENTTLWRFPIRGKWATHNSCYRGNWSPHIPRNLILRYSKEKDLVLDMFVGGGTTLIETKLLNRNGIGIDVNTKAIDLTNQNLKFKVNNDSVQRVILADSTNLNMLNDETIDLICMHPPYANIIKYNPKNNSDISNYPYDVFLIRMEQIAEECYRLLKNKAMCCFMIGDIRKKGNIIPLGFLTLQKFLNKNFILKEIVIKEQFNCSSTKYWKDKSNDFNFLLIAHEYIFILYKRT